MSVTLICANRVWEVWKTRRHFRPCSEWLQKSISEMSPVLFLSGFGFPPLTRGAPSNRGAFFRSQLFRPCLPVLQRVPPPGLDCGRSFGIRPGIRDPVLEVFGFGSTIGTCRVRIFRSGGLANHAERCRFQTTFARAPWHTDTMRSVRENATGKCRSGGQTVPALKNSSDFQGGAGTDPFFSQSTGTSATPDKWSECRNSFLR